MPNVTFVQNLPFPHYGIRSISGALKKHDIPQRLVVTNLEKDPAAILAASSDVVGFYFYSGLFGKIIRFCKKIKNQRPQTLIIVGGPHPTANPDIIKEEGIDIVCIGEGAMEELCLNLKQGKPIRDILNFWVKDSGGIHRNDARFLLTDLDSLPFCNYEIYRQYPEIIESDEFTILASRGCPYKCTYCHNRFARNVYKGKGRWYRVMGPKRLVDEIEVNAAKFKINQVAFADDTWGANRNWMASFAEEYRKRVKPALFCFNKT